MEKSSKKSGFIFFWFFIIFFFALFIWGGCGTTEDGCEKTPVAAPSVEAPTTPPPTPMLPPVSTPDPALKTLRECEAETLKVFSDTEKTIWCLKAYDMKPFDKTGLRDWECYTRYDTDERFCSRSEYDDIRLRRIRACDEVWKFRDQCQKEYPDPPPEGEQTLQMLLQQTQSKLSESESATASLKAALAEKEAALAEKDKEIGQLKSAMANHGVKTPEQEEEERQQMAQEIAAETRRQEQAAREAAYQKNINDLRWCAWYMDMGGDEADDTPDWCYSLSDQMGCPFTYNSEDGFWFSCR